MLLILAPLPSAAAVDVAADHPFIQYSGRFDFANPKKPRCDWPGVSILARFTGKSITVKIGGGSNDFNVIVDGAWKAKLGTDGKTSQVAAEGLADGEHTLLLTKRTEGNQGITTFEGFQLEVGKALLEPPARPAKKIEFIGDSYTVGYGDEAEVLSCPDRRPFDNNYAAYGPVAARAVNAEYSVQAISGLGMVHNYGDPVVLSDKPFPGYYENTLFGSGAPLWDHSKWQPDIVTVALGTNDFSTSVKPSESQYSGAYKEFLKKIRG
ncbi:MAG: GDSL-type esterase/lipase family protein, partial [Fibrobacteria bacterium]